MNNPRTAQAMRLTLTATAKPETRWWVRNRRSEDVTRMSSDTEVPGGRRLKRAAGAVAAVAVLIVAQASAASASTARPPTATQTLSTGPYTWHVATSTG